MDSEESVRQLAHQVHQVIASAESEEGALEEYDWSKIKEVEFQEAYREKRVLLEKLKHFKCNKCPDLQTHVSLVYRLLWKVELVD